MSHVTHLMLWWCSPYPKGQRSSCPQNAVAEHHWACRISHDSELMVGMMFLIEISWVDTSLWLKATQTQPFNIYICNTFSCRELSRKPFNPFHCDYKHDNLTRAAYKLVLEKYLSNKVVKTILLRHARPISLM